MFLNTKLTLVSAVVGAIFFVGCTQKGEKFYHSEAYVYDKYQTINNTKSNNYKGNEKSTTYFNSNNYKSAPNEEIKNSEAMHRATMRPYEVFGKKYYPTLAKVGETHTGYASWYGPDFHSKKTSNGETYNMYAQTAAHKTLPMNTMVRVDNLENGKSTVVRINDRGPFVEGRIIDLSNKAAHDIDMVKKGTARVKLTILGFHAKIAQTDIEKSEVATIGQYYLQVGAFEKHEGAVETQRKFKLILDGKYDVIIKTTDLNRVWVSGFKSEDETRDFKDSNQLKDAVIIAE